MLLIHFREIVLILIFLKVKNRPLLKINTLRSEFFNNVILAYYKSLKFLFYFIFSLNRNLK